MFFNAFGIFEVFFQICNIMVSFELYAYLLLCHNVLSLENSEDHVYRKNWSLNAQNGQQLYLKLAIYGVTQIKRQNV
jgi:hypothetical protein